MEPTELDREFGNRLAKVRLDRGISQQTLAVGLRDFGVEITAGMIGRYENGQNMPNANYILGFCLFFNVNPAWVLSGAGQRIWKHGTAVDNDRLIVAHWLRGQMQSLDELMEGK